MDIAELYSQFRKGVAYFRAQYAAGRGRNPYVARQLAEFEREVVTPMDRAVARLTAADRRGLEAAYDQLD